MYTKSPKFNTPTDTSKKIWRYMNLPKFISMLQSASLMFVKGCMLEDKSEWTVPSGWLEAHQAELRRMEEEYREEELQSRKRIDELIQAEPWAHQWDSLPEDKRPSPAMRARAADDNRAAIVRYEARYKRRPSAQKLSSGKSLELLKMHEIQDLVLSAPMQKERGFMNCWFTSEQESIAMWDLYSSREGGVAIQSTVERLISCLEDCPNPVFVGKVEYIDFQKAKRTSWNHLSTYKRIAFKHEEELRAVILDGEVDRNIMPVVVDINRLIESVYVNPRSENWMVAMIEELASKFDLRVGVQQTNLLG